MQDRTWFGSLIETTIEENFKGSNFNTVFAKCESDPEKIKTEGLRRLTFGDWLGGDNRNGRYSEIQVYQNDDVISKTMDEYLEAAPPTPPSSGRSRPSFPCSCLLPAYAP